MSVAALTEQLLYISTITPDKQVDMGSLLASARRSNSANAVTGLLMFNGKRFLQVLEGAPEAIDATFHRIRCDTRHRGLVLLSRKMIPQREFGDWSMDFRDATQSDVTTLYKTISAKVAHVSPSLRAELTAFAQHI